MKKIFCIFILFVSFESQAQEFWTDISPFGPSDGINLKHVSLNDDAVWFVGSDFFDLVSPIKWGRGINGGTLWATGNVLGLNGVNPSSISAVSATTAYLAAYPLSVQPTGGVWVTNDSGQNWTKQTTALYNSTSSFPSFVHFFDAENGVVVGDPADGYFEIYTTSNGGELWTRVAIENIPSPIEIEFVTITDYESNGNSLWFSTNRNRVFRSADRGATWTANGFLSLYAYIFSKSAFKDEMNGIMVTNSEYEFYKTSDGGENWIPYFTNENTAVRNGRMWDIPGAPFYLLSGINLNTGDHGCSYSADNGVSWFDFDLIDPNPVIPISAAFESLDLAFCVGRLSSAAPNAENRLYRHNSSNLQLSKKSFQKSEEITFFPNPTKDFVQVSGGETISITIFDALGQKIINQPSFSGTIDLSMCQDGIYFAKAISESGTTSTVKIIKQ